MLFDHRTYECRPGTVKDQLALYREKGLAPQTRHLGQPFFYALTETGNPNTFIHIWRYENAGDREARRAALWADPEWLAYVRESREAGYLIRQENRLMVPAEFFELP